MKEKQVNGKTILLKMKEKMNMLMTLKKKNSLLVDGKEIRSGEWSLKSRDLWRKTIVTLTIDMNEGR